MTTADTPDPAGILRAVSELEEKARAATVDGGSWFARDPRAPEFHVYGDFGWVVSGPDVETEDSEWGKAVADHIAAMDPAFVLGLCGAIREVVELHKPVDAGRGLAYCLVCVQHDYTDTQWPCPTLTALARAFAGSGT